MFDNSLSKYNLEGEITFLAFHYYDENNETNFVFQAKFGEIVVAEILGNICLNRFEVALSWAFPGFGLKLYKEAMLFCEENGFFWKRDSDLSEEAKSLYSKIKLEENIDCKMQVIEKGYSENQFSFLANRNKEGRIAYAKRILGLEKSPSLKELIEEFKDMYKIEFEEVTNLFEFPIDAKFPKKIEMIKNYFLKNNIELPSILNS